MAAVLAEGIAKILLHAHHCSASSSGKGLQVTAVAQPLVAASAAGLDAAAAGLSAPALPCC